MKFYLQTKNNQIFFFYRNLYKLNELLKAQRIKDYPNWQIQHLDILAYLNYHQLITGSDKYLLKLIIQHRHPMRLLIVLDKLSIQSILFSDKKLFEILLKHTESHQSSEVFITLLLMLYDLNKLSFISDDNKVCTEDNLLKLMSLQPKQLFILMCYFFIFDERQLLNQTRFQGLINCFNHANYSIKLKKYACQYMSKTVLDMAYQYAYEKVQALNYLIEDNFCTRTLEDLIQQQSTLQYSCY